MEELNESIENIWDEIESCAKAMHNTQDWYEKPINEDKTYWEKIREKIDIAKRLGNTRAEQPEVEFKKVSFKDRKTGEEITYNAPQLQPEASKDKGECEDDWKVVDGGILQCSKCKKMKPWVLGHKSYNQLRVEPKCGSKNYICKDCGKVPCFLTTNEEPEFCHSSRERCEWKECGEMKLQ